MLRNRDLNKCLYLLVANLLESTEVRNVAITQIQFGMYFKEPETFFTNVMVPEGLKLMDKPFFKTFCKDVEVLSADNFNEIFSKFLVSAFDEVELIGIISGTTRPKDRTWHLFADYRGEMQLAWESLIYNDYPGGKPSSDSQPPMEA